MKKFTAVTIMCLLLTMAIGLMGCGSADTPQKTEKKNVEESTSMSADKPEEEKKVGKFELTEPVTLTFAAQEVGTAAYNYATALQTVMLKKLPEGSKINITTTSPGGVGAPIIVNGAEQCDIIASNGVPAKQSYETGILGKEATKEIAVLAGGLGHDFLNVMFTKKFVDTTGISTVEELIEKEYPVKLVIKKNGTFGEMSAENLFKAFDLTLDDIVAWGGVVEKTGGDAIKSGLQDDLYDMTIDHIGAGQSNTTELCLTHEMVDVQLAEETLKKLEEMGYERTSVEPNTWNGQTEEIFTVGSQQNILVSTSMDDALAYTLTKAVCEHADELGDAVAAMKFFDPETAGIPAKTGAPLHPGAQAYYEEMGYPTK
ncbi:MAG: TAXI family TRAP transporter solute-binding subunit [Eubacteriales bacterium]|nr:TAXI family TRAP transporter solute-binding subunit [Eubacteriales bacterium]